MSSLCAVQQYSTQTPEITLFLRRFNPPHKWVNADFHDTIPWGTTEFLDLYPEPIDDGVSQVDSKSKETTGADAEERANQPHDEWLKNDKQIILNWMH